MMGYDNSVLPPLKKKNNLDMNIPITTNLDNHLSRIIVLG